MTRNISLIGPVKKSNKGSDGPKRSGALRRLGPVRSVSHEQPGTDTDARVPDVPTLHQPSIHFHLQIMTPRPILTAEDDTSLRDAFSRLFLKHGIRLTAAEDGAKAIASIRVGADGYIVKKEMSVKKLLELA